MSRSTPRRYTCMRILHAKRRPSLSSSRTNAASEFVSSRATVCSRSLRRCKMPDYAGWKQDDDRSTSGKSARTRCLPETIRHNPPVGICDAMPDAALRRYYEAVRPSPAHRYFQPRGWSRLCFFPWHRRPGSHVPYKSLVELRAASMPDASWAVSGISQDDPERLANPRF
jgi:hypothetical protein